MAGEEGQADDRGNERTGAARRCCTAAGTARRSPSGTGRRTAGGRGAAAVRVAARLAPGAAALAPPERGWTDRALAAHRPGRSGGRAVTGVRRRSRRGCPGASGRDELGRAGRRRCAGRGPGAGTGRGSAWHRGARCRWHWTWGRWDWPWCRWAGRVRAVAGCRWHRAGSVAGRCPDAPGRPAVMAPVVGPRAGPCGPRLGAGRGAAGTGRGAAGGPKRGAAEPRCRRWR